MHSPNALAHSGLAYDVLTILHNLLPSSSTNLTTFSCTSCNPVRASPSPTPNKFFFLSFPVSFAPTAAAALLLSYRERRRESPVPVSRPYLRPLSLCGTSTLACSSPSPRWSVPPRHRSPPLPWCRPQMATLSLLQEQIKYGGRGTYPLRRREPLHCYAMTGRHHETSPTPPWQGSSAATVGIRDGDISERCCCTTTPVGSLPIGLYGYSSDVER
ncbi:hypothetical protein FKP32DRAFT_288418 [Trametes sanguinea]|nr:hypothetical protein FKP32DRAFT_288418 [Trametes sanguinea]